MENRPELGSYLDLSSMAKLSKKYMILVDITHVPLMNFDILHGLHS